MRAHGDASALLDVAIDAAVAAGRATLAYFGGDLATYTKPDNSPLTLADTAAHDEICTRLLHQTDLPILSEEGTLPDFGERAKWERFWLVDPLDGTAEFIDRSGEYTINIALIRNGSPELGVVYVPTNGTLYAGGGGLGATVIAGGAAGSSASPRRTLPLAGQRDSLMVTTSRRHASPATRAFIERARAHFGPVHITTAGSSVKICHVAEGTADFYPRYGATMEWDTAAGDAVLRAAGGSLVDTERRQPLVYNKRDLRNPYFIAVAPGRDLPPTLP